jgi:16S rRNA (adenine1518-N6/adenine1519-N6)-dimethyltransferase
VQKEFAEKILALPGSPRYRAISVIAQTLFQVKQLFEISQESFDPPPNVISTVLYLVPKEIIYSGKFSGIILKKIFSFRGKKVSTAIKTMYKKDAEKQEKIIKLLDKTLLRKRIEQLSVDEAYAMGKILEALNHE